MKVIKAATAWITFLLLVCATTSLPYGWVSASDAAAGGRATSSESVTMRRERLRVLRLQALGEYAGYTGAGYPGAIPALVTMLHDEPDPEIASGIVKVLGEIAALDELGDLHRSVTDPTLAAEIETQLSKVLADPRPVYREQRVSGALAVAGFLGGYGDLLQPAAVIMLAAPALLLALWCFVHMPLRASITRLGLISGAGIGAVVLGGMAGLLGGDVPRADPGSALVIFIPFVNAVVLLPIVLCACVIRLNTGSDRMSTASNAVIWAAAYALLQFGTWAFIPLILRGHYSYYGRHPSWISVHVAHSIAVAVTCALIGWRLAAADGRIRASRPLDQLTAGAYVAVLFPCLAVLGLGYLLVNAYAF
jgi:hypothetical protein